MYIAFGFDTHIAEAISAENKKKKCKSKKSKKIRDKNHK